MSVKISFDKLDAIRGIAAFYVCINHSRGNFFEGVNSFLEKNPQSSLSLIDKFFLALTQMTILGHEFVILFFVLSGFSIAYSITRSTDTFQFLKRRAIRLYPPYLAGIFWAYLVYTLIYFFHSTWFDPNTTITTAKLLSKVNMYDPIIFLKNLIYINNGFIIIQYWSLVHEIIFYALIPVFILRPRVYMIVSVLLFILHFILWGTKYTENFGVLTSFFLHYNIYFALGVGLYLYKDKLLKPVIDNKIINIIIAIGLFFACIGVKLLTGKYDILPELVSAILCVHLMQLFLNYNVGNSVLLYLGHISYTLYVTHFATIFFIKFLAAKLLGYDGGPINNYYIWMVVPLICVAVAHVFYIIAEKPSKDYLAKLRKSR